MSEERVRLSMLNGLLVARPQEAYRMRTESTVPWEASSCACGASVLRGRRLAFDLGVAPASGGELLAACELKWIKKTPKAKEVAQDVWKLVLTQAANPSMSAFMLCGGERAAVQTTLEALRLAGKRTLKWSLAGRQKGAPRKWTIDLRKAATRPGPWSDALRQLLQWGRGKHYRTAPECSAETRVMIRSTWCMTAGKRQWLLVLWEFQHNNNVVRGRSGVIQDADWHEWLRCPST